MANGPFPAQNSDGSAVLQGILAHSSTSELYVKQMGKHLAYMDEVADDFLGKTRNFILIRNPVDALASFEKVAASTLQ